MSVDNWDNYFEAYEVIRFDDGVRYRYFNGRIGNALRAGSPHPLGSIQCERTRRKTPSYEEQLKRMGMTVSPEQLEEWKRVAKLYAPRKNNRPKERVKEIGECDDPTHSATLIACKAAGTNLIFGISRKAQAELEREYDAEFENWRLSQITSAALNLNERSGEQQ
jgi:hypothetical protein